MSFELAKLGTRSISLSSWSTCAKAGLGLKARWLAIPPIVFTAALVLLLFVPIVVNSNATHQVCDPYGCVRVVQYESIGYAYGGWGAYYQTGVNYYTVQEWICSCPPNSTSCCIPPFQGIIEAIVVALLAADLGSIFLAVRWRRAPC